MVPSLSHLLFEAVDIPTTGFAPGESRLLNFTIYNKSLINFNYEYGWYNNLHESFFPLIKILNVLGSLKTTKEILEAITNHTSFTPLGEGEGRIVFKLADPGENFDIVLKVAKGRGGILQNQKEEQIGGNPDFENVVAQVYAAHKDDLWIVSDYVIGFKPQEEDEFAEEFYAEMGMAPEELRQLIEGDTEEDLEYEGEHSQFIKDLRDLVHTYDISLADLEKPEHYGKRKSDGQLVLLDYGFHRSQRLREETCRRVV